MTYKLNPEIRKIVSPVVIIYPDGRRQFYCSGKAVTDAVFDRNFAIESMGVTDNVIEIRLVEHTVQPVNPFGDETFF